MLIWQEVVIDRGIHGSININSGDMNMKEVELKLNK